MFALSTSNIEDCCKNGWTVDVSQFCCKIVKDIDLPAKSRARESRISDESHAVPHRMAEISRIFQLINNT